MSNVLSTLFGEIANAIREKTGDTGAMKPAQFPEKIGAIEVGGGASADVRYVTFMNGDVELYRKPVAVGDDCVNVLTKGWIATPTKESTVSEVFAYSGWALTDGGNADSSALLAVEEDRTVYAAYTASARMYTVNFYDGETLIESKQVAYGSTPSINAPTKDGFSFTEWQPAVTSVTGDVNYYAQWQEKLTFAGGSWADIARVSEAGEAQQHFALGDERNELVTYNGVYYTVKLRIAGFSHDDLADGSGKAGMTIVSHTCISTTLTDYSADLTTMTYLDAYSVFKGFSDDLKNHVKKVIKVRNNVGKKGALSGNPVYTLAQDSIPCFFLSPAEAGMGAYSTSSMYDPDGIGVCYPLYESYHIGDRSYKPATLCDETGAELSVYGASKAPASRIVSVWQSKLLALAYQYSSIKEGLSKCYKSVIGFCI